MFLLVEMCLCVLSRVIPPTSNTAKSAPGREKQNKDGIFANLGLRWPRCVLCCWGQGWVRSRVERMYYMGTDFRITVAVAWESTLGSDDRPPERLRLKRAAEVLQLPS